MQADHEEEHVSARYIFACNLCKDVVCHFPTKDCLRKHFSSIQNCYRLINIFHPSLSLSRTFTLSPFLYHIYPPSLTHITHLFANMHVPKYHQQVTTQLAIGRMCFENQQNVISLILKQKMLTLCTRATKLFIFLLKSTF